MQLNHVALGLDAMISYVADLLILGVGLANCGFYGILLITSRKHSYAKLLIGRIRMFIPLFVGAAVEPLAQTAMKICGNRHHFRQYPHTKRIFGAIRRTSSKSCQ